MIISMRPHATREEIDHVCERIREFGYKVHSIEGEERVVIGVVGVGDVTACLESLEATPGVETRRAHFGAVQVRQPGIPKRALAPSSVNGVEIGGDEFDRDGRAVLGGKRKADHGDGRRRGRGRRPHAARRRVQTAHFALRFPGHGTGGAEAAAQGQGSHRPRHRHRGHERPRRGPGGRIRRLHAGGRAQHAELRAAEIAGRAAAGRCC